MHAGVNLDQQGHLDPGGIARLGDRTRRDRPVDGDGHLDAAGKTRQALHLGCTDEVVGDQDVIEPGIGKDFRLAKLLAGDPLGAGRDLHVTDGRDLVGLDVGAIGEAKRIQAGLQALDVRFQLVEIHHHRRRIEVCHALHRPVPLCTD